MDKAGLNLVHYRDVTMANLFKNMEAVWINIGRQPVIRDMKAPISKYSVHQYVAKFGTWRKALESFVEAINTETGPNQHSDSADENMSKVIINNENVVKHMTKRYPNERLKVQVLMRDGNICKLCGITVTGDNIHFDHIKPWSRGGETVLANLQVLCSKHNLAKGNLE